MSTDDPKSPNSEEYEALNLDVYLALSRVRRDAVADLVKLLRSDAPIDPVVRHAMADGFEGLNAEARLTFRVEGQRGGSLSNFAERFYRFSRDIAIARYIQELRSENGMTAEAAELQAEAQFHIGTKTCHAATSKARAMDIWLEKNFSSRPRLMKHVTPQQWQHAQQMEYFVRVVDNADQS